MTAQFKLAWSDAVETFGDVQARARRALELHRQGQVTAQWCETMRDILVQLPSRQVTLPWDGRGHAKDVVREAWPSAVAFRFPDYDPYPGWILA